MNEFIFPPASWSDLIDAVDHLVGLFTTTEFLLALAFVSLAIFKPRLGSRTFAAIERAMHGLASHPVRQLLAVAVLAVLCRAAFFPWLAEPVAANYDEQSMLLQAQTFMAGRFASPTHPLWEHFETFYVNQVPTYASMYFPGRGAPLYAGLALAGNAWIGVWLSVVMMCVAATWMLQGWVSLPMAFLGGVLVTLRLGIFSFWVNSYYGGALTAVGALLVFGALPRVLSEPRWRHGVVMGLGATILMITRPYEGMLLCIPVGAAVLFRWIRPGWAAGKRAIVRLAIPVALMTGAGGALLLSYNLATTGAILKTPYSVHRETYANVPAFLFSPQVASLNRGPAYFRTYFEAEARSYHYRESPVTIIRSLLSKIFHTWNFYLGATLSIAFFVGWWVCRRDRILMGTLAFFFAGYLLETWNFPQYTAPIFPVLLVLTMRGFEWLRSRDEKTQPWGLFLARAMPAATLALLVLPAASLVFGFNSIFPSTVQAVCCSINYDKLRPALAEQLHASPGRDLVLVKDGMQNPVNYELVYNEPDIDGSEIVWAHRLSPEKDQKLQSYFQDRRVWEFEWLPDTPLGYRFTALTP